MHRTKVLILFIICMVTYNSDLLSQKNKLLQIDNLMKQIPDSSTISTDGIAAYISSNINDQRNRAYATFSWIAENIQYDVENMFNIDFYQPSDVVINKVLSTRKGVCLHFSDLFQEIAEKVGIKSYVVLGYTKQNGLIDHFPHSWCAGLIDTTWYLFDPAWGSGYFEKGVFYKQKNLKQFMVSPSRFIKTHMPFDPIWQFLNYPKTNQDFYYPKTTLNPGNTYYNYIDSINKYEHQSDLEKLESSISRIKQNGITNVLIIREMNYMQDQIISRKYSDVVTLYNEGISLLNQSIQIWNEFNPGKNTKKIIELLDLSENSLKVCRANLSEIKNQTGLITTSVNQMYALIDIAEKSIKDLRASVLRYLNTQK